MSGEAISRDELKAMLEVQSKNTEQLTIIANHLQVIVEQNDKTNVRLYNGIAKEITVSIAEVLKGYKEQLTKEHSEHDTKLDVIKDTVNFNKWVITGSFSLATLAFVVVEFIKIFHK